MAMLTKTLIIIGLALFYTIISIFMGIGFQDMATLDNATVNNATLPNSNAVVHVTGWSFGNVIDNISIFPWWANSIIFTPLVIGLGFILLTSFIPTLDGGN